MAEKNDLEKAHAAKVEAKKRKPSFVAQDSHKKKRIKKSWRKPDGSDSKMRRSIKGYRKIVKAGFGTSEKLRGVSRKGYKIVKINSLKEFKELVEKNEKTDFPLGLEISSGLSKKTKVEIVTIALEKKIHIVSIKKPEEFLKSVDSELKARKEKRKSRELKIKAKEKDAKKKDKKEKKKTDDSTEAKKTKEQSEAIEKGKSEKKEKDKILAKGE